MARIKNTDVYVFDTVPEVSSFLVGSDQGDGRITKSYRIDALFGLAETEGFIKEAPIDGQPYIRQDGDWELVPASGVGSVFSVFGRTGAVTGLVGDYSAFYALVSHTHLEADITDLQSYLLPSDIGTTVQAWSAPLDAVLGTNTGDQTTIVGISSTKAQFNTALSDGSFIFVGDAPTAHTHTESDITDLQAYLLAADIDTLAELNAIITDATLIDTTDSRLSDARTPLSHTHVEADITDLQAYLLSVDMSDINATGTPSAATWLRGDGTWGTILAGVSSVFGRTAAVVAVAGDYDAFYYTETESDANFAPIVHTHAWGDITSGVPTTISGYGITDAYTKSETDGKYLLNTTDTLVGSLTLENPGNVVLDIYSSTANVDEGRWDWTHTTTGGLTWNAVNDAESVSTTFMSVARTGTVIDTLDLTATAINVDGALNAIDGNITSTISGRTHNALLGTSSAAGEYLYGGNSAGGGTYTDYLRVGINSKLQFTTSGTGAGDHDIWHDGRIGVSGAWFNSIPGLITGSGVMEVGRYIDMHNADAGITDYDIRLNASNDQILRVHSGDGTTVTVESYVGADDWGRLGANTSGGFINLSDGAGGSSTIVRGYGESDFYQGDINVYNGHGVTANFFSRLTGTTGIQDSSNWDTEDGAIDAHAFWTTSNTTASTGYPNATGQTWWLKGASDARSFAFFTSATSTRPANSFYVGHMDLVGGWMWYKSLNEGTYIADIDGDDQNVVWTLRSKADVTLHLEADTDNVTETDNPVFKMSQDGGIKYLEMGLSSAAANGLDTTASNDVWFRTNTTTENFHWGGNTTGRMTLDNGNGNLTLHNGGLILAATGDITMGTSGSTFIHNAVSGRDKIRVWSSTPYSIGMGSGYTYGGLNNDFAMTFQMNSDADRGFWWGDSDHTNAQGAMALTTQGKLTVATGIRVGYGETDTTTPSATWDIQVSGDIQAADYALASDRRLKENTEDLDNGWWKFNYKGKDRVRYGVMADEVKIDYPEIVTTDEDGFDSVSYTDYFVVKLAEKDKQIKSLKGKMESLEARLDLLIKNM